MQEKARRRSTNQLKFYRPYPKQRDFHGAGAVKRERLFMAGNQTGKTIAGAYETAMHLTGRYPEGWQGWRFDKAVSGWVGGLTGLAVRDSVQKLLLGELGKFGTGSIPADDLLDWSMARGMAGAVDTIQVKHISGGTSRLTFKSYESGREKWQAATLDFVWFDEEPDQGIYTEGLTRTNATGGRVWMTFTPLLGMSDVVMNFLGKDATGDRSVTTMTIDDAEHYTAEQRAQIIASYPAHEREARTKGVPSLGSGRIFPIEESIITIPSFEIPPHWVQLGALDFGWDHPTAAVKLAWDRDADCAYVTHAYRMREATPVIHAASLKPWGLWLPWAWPHDGLQTSKDSGVALAEQYKRNGLKMLPEHATFPDGSNGVEAGLMEMLERMETGRLKVFAHLADWFEEFRMYHRKDGRVVKERDDIMSATRYGIMSLRFAKVAEKKKFPAAVPTHGPRTGNSAWQGA